MWALSPSGPATNMMDPLKDNPTPATSRSSSTQHISELGLSRRKNPPRLDLSKLFPKRKSSPQAPRRSSHRRPSNNSSTSTSNSADLSSSQSTPSSWSNRLMGANPNHQAQPRSPKALEMKSPKINIRRPPPGIKHWFDGLTDEWADSDEALMPGTHEAADIRRELDGFTFSKNHARDTFLSMSTIYLEQPVKRPCSPSTKDVSRRRSMSLQQPPSVAPTQSDRTGETSSSESTERQSRISDDTVRHEADHAKRVRHPAARRNLKHAQSNTVFQGHSILVLSDPEDSDDGLDDETVAPVKLGYRETSTSSHVRSAADRTQIGIQANVFHSQLRFFRISTVCPDQCVLRTSISERQLS